MKWQTLSKAESETLYEEFSNYLEPQKRWDKCPEEYLQLRNELEQIMNNVMQNLDIDREDIQKKSGNAAYLVDLNFGIEMYALLNNKYEMDVRQAASEGIWRFLSMKVAPELIEMRYGYDHPDRFWKKSKRLWFRVLWWYIYLSWQGDAESTRKILQNNTTDEILQLVDRCGRGGYRVELYREIMKSNAAFSEQERKQGKLFRKVMVLNTARLQVMEPALTENGETGYVTDLCQYFRK